MDLVIVRGGGDIASGIIHRLYRAGFKILVLEIEKPLSIRREVSFSEAIYKGEVEVEGVKGIFVKTWTICGKLYTMEIFPYILIPVERS